MIYGYARVSTKSQEKDGNSLEYQEKLLRENGAEEIFSDSFTGTKIDRPEFDKLKGRLKSGDKLIVTKLDRFARSAAQGSELIESLIEEGVTVHILNMGVMDNTPTGKLIRTIMLGFAEFERDMIVQRTQEGKEVARGKGTKVDGRPFYMENGHVEEWKARDYLKRQRNKEMTVDDCCKQLNVSRSYWYKVIAKLD